MRFTTFWPCNGNASFCAPRILAEGTIQNDTANQFLRFLGSTRSHAHPLPPNPTIVFNSLGGSIAGGMALGELIRQRNLDTEMHNSYSRAISLAEEEVFVKDAVCASACVLAFAGGQTRLIQPEAKLGIHQFAATKGNIGDSAAQTIVVVLAAYLSKMGIDRRLLDAASLIPPDSMRWLTEREAKAFLLDNSTVALTPWRITATDQGIPVLELSQLISPGRTLLLRVAQFSSFYTVVVTLSLNKSVHLRERILLYPATELPEVTMCGDEHCVKGYASKSWNQSETRDVIRFQSVVAFLSEDFSRLSRARILSISDNIHPALSDIGISTKFPLSISTDGFAPGIALLRRTPN